MRHVTTSEERAKSQQRRERFRQLVKQVASMTDAERDQLAARMIGLVTCVGGALSAHNVRLLAMQCPSATIVGGFRQWLKQGRAVRKGEHGYMIWCPSVRKGEHGYMIWCPSVRKADADACAAAGVDPSTQPDETRFIVGTVFDISQTDEIQSADDAERVEDLRSGDEPEIADPTRAQLSRHAAFMRWMAQTTA